MAESSINPLDYGAKADGATDDTAAWQAAVNDAITRKLPIHQPPGRTRLIPLTTRLFYFPSVPAVEVFAAVRVLGSGLRIVGHPNGSFIFGAPSGVTLPSTSRSYMFATRLNKTPGAIKDIALEGVRVDFTDAFGTIPPTPYAFNLMGVDNFFVDGCEFFNSSSTRRGWAITAHNIRRMRLRNSSWSNINQGANLRYVYDVDLEGLTFSTFAEGLDFDGVGARIRGRGLAFTGGGSGIDLQCIDLASCKDVHIDGIIAIGVNNIVEICDKVGAWPTYAEFVDNIGSYPGGPNVVLTENVTISGIRARDCNLPGRYLITIGSARDSDGPAQDGKKTVRGVSIVDAKLVNSRPIMVWEGRDILLQDILIRSPVATTGTEGAINANSSVSGPIKKADSDLTLTMKNVTVIDAPGMGIYVERAGNFVADGITVSGYNLSGLAAESANGFHIARIDSRNGRHSLANLDIAGGAVTPSTPATSTTSGTPETLPKSLRISDNAATFARVAVIGVNRLPDGVVFGGALSHTRLATRDVELPRIDVTTATGISPLEVTLLRVSEGASRIARISLMSSELIRANTTNYVICQFFRRRAGTDVLICARHLKGSGPSSDQDYGAGSDIDLAWQVDEPDAQLQAGDLIYARFTRAGSGGSLSNIWARVAEIPYRTA